MRTSPAFRPLLVGLLFVMCLVPACARKGAGPGRGGFKMPPTPVEVADVTVARMSDAFRALGSLEALQEAEIVAEVSARVVSMPFPEGRSVDSGTVIARLDDQELKAQRDRAVAALTLARSEAKRVEDLFARDVVSPRERDESRASLDAAVAEAALQSARFERTVVRAPFTGVTGRRLASVGGYVRANDPLVHLARLDRLRVKFAVPERYTSVLHAGARATVAVTAWPTQTFPAWITVVEPNVDPESRTFTAVAEVRNVGARLRPGMSADVIVALSERSGALTVPDEAVVSEGDQAFVYKVGPDSTVSRAPVSLGTRDSSRVEILSGLAAGDRVVRAGHQKLYPGAKVMPVSSLSAAGAGTAAPGVPPGKPDAQPRKSGK